MKVVTVGAINYIAAAIFALPGFWASEPSERVANAVWTGGVMGTCYFVAFFFLIYAIHWVGASNSAAVSRVSLVIPICAGIWLWGESPDFFEIVGISLAFVSLFLIGRTSSHSIHGKKATDSPLVSPVLVSFVLAVFFLICGASRVMQQSCKQLSDGVADYPAFLLTAFIAAAIPSIGVLIWNARAISRRELIAGILLGLTNILQSHYILKSLDEFDGFLVFTITSTGGLVFTTGVAIFYFQEKVDPQSAIGIALASISILFLQLPIAELLATS